MIINNNSGAAMAARLLGNASEALQNLRRLFLVQKYPLQMKALLVLVLHEVWRASQPIKLQSTMGNAAVPDTGWLLRKLGVHWIA